MPINEMWLEIDGEHTAKALQEVLDKMDRTAGEVVLDFSSVRRVDTGALRAMAKLAAAAGGKAVKVVLRGVNVDIYKALKLVKLAPRFSFQP